MRFVFACGVLALGLSACTDDSPSLRLLSARAFNDACEVQGSDVFVKAGSFDVGARELPGLSVNAKLFPVPFSVESSFGTGSSAVDVNGQPINGAERFDITVKSYEIRYSSALALPDQEVPIYAVFRGNTDPDDSFITLNLLTPESHAALLTTATATPETVLVGLKLKGETRAGSSVESNEVEFPLTVSNSGGPTTCPAGTVPNVTICGGAGYNGDAPCAAP